MVEVNQKWGGFGLLAQEHTVDKWKGQDSNEGLSGPKTQALAIVLIDLLLSE